MAKLSRGFVANTLLCALLLTCTAVCGQYASCSVSMQEATLVGMVNGEPMINSKVVCDGQTVYEQTVKVSDIAPVEIDGTPLTIFPSRDDFCAVVLISGAQEVFTMTDSRFVDLPALDEADLYQSELRAPLVIEDSSVVMKNVLFSMNNHNGYTSGGVYLQVTDDAATDQEYKVHMENCTFTNNRGESAGGIVVDGFPSLEIVGSKFSSETPVGIGVLEGSKSSTILVKDSEFEGVPAGQAQTGKSSAILGKSPGIITIEGTVFTRNKKPYGGAVAWENLETDEVVQLGFSGCRFEDNEAMLGGGAIFAGTNVALSVDSTTFESNNAASGGACMLAGAISGTMQSSKFAGNIATSDGGAVEVTAAHKLVFENANGPVNTVLSLVGVHFIENRCEFGDGGALLSQTGTVSIEGGAFISNTAGERGGAVYLGQNPSVDISNSTFESNSAPTASGGAIFAEDVATFTISDTDFRLNTAVAPCSAKSAPEDGGGALAFEGASGSTLTVTRSIFEGNSGARGGSLYLDDVDKLVLEDCEMFKGVADLGGVLVMNDAIDVLITRCTFESCNACSWDGAVMRVQGKHTGSFSSTDSKYIGNSAATEDGGVAKVEKFGSVSFTNDVFHSNTAGDSGGALYIKTSDSLRVSGTDFTSNSAENGGCISVVYVHKVIIIESEFSECKAKKKGGAITGHSLSDSFTIQDSTISSAVAGESGYGGAINLDAAGECKFVRTNLLGCHGSQGGAVSLVSCDDVGFEDCEIAQNKATGMGGGIYAEKTKTLTMTGCNIHDNIAEDIGGGLLVFAGSAPLEDVVTDTSAIVENCEIESNKAESGGGMHLSSFESVSLSAATLSHNGAAKNGGNLLLQSSKTVAISQNTVLIYGDAGQAGGGSLIGSVGKLTLDEVTCSHNHANGLTGGGMSLANVNELDAVHVTWEANDATSSGGACLLSGDWSSAIFDDCHFLQNKAENGGGVWAVGPADANPESMSNDAAATEEDDTLSSPPVVEISGARIEFTSTEFLENTASEDGGAVVISQLGSASLLHSTFKENTANKGGNIVTENVGQMDIRNVSLSDATADEIGGGLYMSSIDNLMAQNISLTTNSAQIGGGLVCDGETSGTILASDFMENEAGTGSALYATCGCILEVMDSNFQSFGGSNDNPVAGDPTCTDVQLVNCTSSFVARVSGFSWWTIVLFAVILLIVVGLGVILWTVVPAVSRDVPEEPERLEATASMGLVEPLVVKSESV